MSGRTDLLAAAEVSEVGISSLKTSAIASHAVVVGVLARRPAPEARAARADIFS